MPARTANSPALPHTPAARLFPPPCPFLSTMSLTFHPETPPVTALNSASTRRKAARICTAGTVPHQYHVSTGRSTGRTHSAEQPAQNAAPRRDATPQPRPCAAPARPSPSHTSHVHLRHTRAVQTEPPPSPQSRTALPLPSSLPPDTLHNTPPSTHGLAQAAPHPPSGSQGHQWAPFRRQRPAGPRPRAPPAAAGPIPPPPRSPPLQTSRRKMLNQTNRQPPNPHTLDTWQSARHGWAAGVMGGAWRSSRGMEPGGSTGCAA